eukprot:CAMPEP_0119496978 /NCGR_PEP_ID=MMETSP1344-20130328/20159_1 /TAXON_ID=236787 /ORGANISM="Florenciella parvula, Strain CCMP2471" /LENGTH=37 /DNA_ID= /DNA_START= /DNA_END= /DNA_ORIENTATION=
MGAALDEVDEVMALDLAAVTDFAVFTPLTMPEPTALG